MLQLGKGGRNMDKDKLSEAELSYWLAFDSLGTTNVYRALVRRLVDRFQGIAEAWRASSSELKGIGGLSQETIDNLDAKRQEAEPEKLLQELTESGVQAFPFTDVRYPYRLRQTADCPLILYVCGELRDHDFNHAVAVVGTRRPTSYGQTVAKDIGRGLAANGVVVVSGMALGIDSIAHWGAIEGGGRTVAVVGSGPDLCYPSTNRRLYSEILEGGHGAIVSEYFPGVEADKWRFPARNRIISGLSAATVVVEAGQTSGALITARLAFEQDREVFAVPGRVDSPMSEGTNELFINTMAKMCRNHADVLSEMNWVRTTVREMTTVVQLYGKEKDIYQMLSNEPVHFDVICEETKMQAGELSAALTMLELAGLITRHPGDWYSKQQPGDVKFAPTRAQRN